MYTHILVPIDGSATSNRALIEAAELARVCSAHVRLLHVVDTLAYTHGFEPPEVYISQTRPLALQAGEQLLARARAELEAYGLGLETELRESIGVRVSDVIIDCAASWGADLIVLGTHGRRGIDRILMGSDAEQVVRTSPVPVLLVRLPSASTQPTQSTDKLPGNVWVANENPA